MSGTAGGMRHWRHQRFTSIVLLPLGGWFVISMLSLPDLSQATVLLWLGAPLQALLMALFAGIALWHSAQGWRVVLEDYVGGGLLQPALWISRILHLAAATTLFWAVTVIAATGA